MVQYYNTGDKDSTNLIAYASDLSMFAMLFTDMQNGTLSKSLSYLRLNKIQGLP